MASIFDDPPRTIRGYDLPAEKERYRYPDVEGQGRSINRGTATVEISGDVFSPHQKRAREKHQNHIFTTTHDASSPVIELGYPVAGPFHVSSQGVWFDALLGCAQKVLDTQHPYYRRTIEALHDSRLLLRREINTDDYLVSAPELEGVPMPQDLAELVTDVAAEEFPGASGYRVFFSNSGAESVEAGIKLACLVTWRRLQERYGRDTMARVLDALGIDRHPTINETDPHGDEEVMADYPLFIVGFQGAFHGRTHGALSLTNSKRAHQYGYWKSRWVRHIPFNCDPERLEALVDERSLPELLDEPGELERVVGDGRIPADLLAGLVAEPMQGEGGYAPGDPDRFRAYGRLLKSWDALFILDEVQTFGRTGHLFCSRHFLNDPDILAVAKGGVIGLTIARKGFEKYLHGGWHSNTWGGGKVLDTAFAHATFDALAYYKDPVFAGLSYAENCRVKADYLRWHLDRIAETHPEIVVEHSGYGLMQGVTVRRREELVDLAWRRGLHVLGCGPAGETSRLRLLFLADTTTREIEEFARVFEAVISELKSGEPADREPAGATGSS